MQLRRVLVTGASGFVGAVVVERLRAAGDDVVGIDREPATDADVVVADIAEPETYEHLLADTDLVVHAAALVTLAGDRDEFWRVNTLGTREVIRAAARQGVRRVVHLSSIVVFGLDFPDDVDETWPVRTTGAPYVDTKISAEQVALMAHAAGDIEVTVIRPGDVYGPRSSQWTVAPVEELRRGRLILPAHGEGIISPVYVDNLVDGILLAADEPKAAGHVITITDGVGITTSEFFGRYADLMRVPRPRTAPAVLLRPASSVVGLVDRIRGESSHMSGHTIDYLQRTATYDITKARTLLGYAPKVGLDEGFARASRWLLEEGIA
ncbi:MAG: NAD-dependent epimerase/dehydratase family protein [Actinobacteria bacterium]|nr:NAD-dependent epimerase/dehydratase family protein [Actinomycetota bacterium]